MTRPDATTIAQAALRVLSWEFTGLRPSLGPEAPHLWRQCSCQVTADELAKPGTIEAQGKVIGAALATDVKRRRGSPHRWMEPKEEPVPEGFEVVSTALFTITPAAAEAQNTHAISVRARQIARGDVHRFEVSIDCH